MFQEKVGSTTRIKNKSMCTNDGKDNCDWEKYLGVLTEILYTCAKNYCGCFLKIFVPEE